MPIKINNFESNIRMEDNGASGGISENDIERIVDLVIQKINEEKNRQDRIEMETKINNSASTQDLFD